MSRGLAIVGTDTGVGKTVVAAGLLRGLRQRGLAALPFKPVETGLRTDTPSLTVDGETADWVRLSRETDAPANHTLGCSFALPAAPLVAARAEGQRVPLARLEEGLNRLTERADVVLVEGAGGLCVPLTEDRLWLDQLVHWRLTALVVARLGLGTINHTLLTVNALLSREVPVLGVILNTLSAPGPETEMTSSTIASFLDIPVFSPLPLGVTDSPAVATHLGDVGVLDRVLAWNTDRLLSQAEP